MSYYFETQVHDGFDETVEKVTQCLAAHGFGVLTTIDVAATMKAKLDVDMPPYRILGACNPHFAHQALQAEPQIGTMLPCNVIVREADDGQVVVAAVDPVASMQAIENPSLGEVADRVRQLLQQVIGDIG